MAQDHYGTLVEANNYFASRMHTYDWDRSTVEDRIAAMVEATELIDQFEYIGQKYAVQQVKNSIIDEGGDLCDDSNIDLMQAAEISQILEFPRGDLNLVPKEIEQACYLIAQALLSGRNPDMDLEDLGLSSASFAGMRAGFDRSLIMEHIAHLIPSPEAFSLLRPFFRPRNEFTLKRV